MECWPLKGQGVLFSGGDFLDWCWCQGISVTCLEVLIILCVVEHSDVSEMAWLLLVFSLVVSNAMDSIVCGLSLSLWWGMPGLAEVICTIASASAVAVTLGGGCVSKSGTRIASWIAFWFWSIRTLPFKVPERVIRLINVLKVFRLYVTLCKAINLSDISCLTLRRTSVNWIVFLLWHFNLSANYFSYWIIFNCCGNSFD